MLITILMFIFSKVLSVIFFGLIWSQNLMFSNLTEILFKGTLLYADYEFDAQFFELFAINKFLGGKLHPQICCSPYLLKFTIEVR